MRKASQRFLSFGLVYLEDCQTRLGKGVKVTPGVDGVGELATENLHPQQREYEDEQEQNDKQRVYGRD